MQGKDYSILLVLAVCCMVFCAAFQYLSAVISFLERLEDIAQLNSQMMRILFKATGIGILSEITALVCKDMGNEVLGKSILILASATILWLALPLLEELLNLIEAVLGGV